jgi:plasmid replication initiation protein
MQKYNLPKTKMYESKTPKIYKNKKLNHANFSDFTHNDYQVFLHLVSKTGGVNQFGKYLQPEQLQREHTLRAKEFSEYFNIDIHNAYRILKKAADKLMKTDITLEKMELNEVWRINICSMAKYNKDMGSITIQFTDSIMPYISQVRQRFVLYNLKEVSNFGSLYTTRLYELIQEFKETGWIEKSVEELREVFAVGNKFKLYGHFKKNTFAHACQEINDNYDINLKFIEKKEGRKVDKIRFTFTPLVAQKIINKKSGEETTIYQKIKRKNIQKIVESKKIQNERALSEQMAFDDIDKKLQEVEIEPKSVRRMISSIISKLTYSKK